MSRLTILIMLSTLLLCVIVGSSGRRRPRQKVGVCPILLSPQICWNSCDIDNDCHEDYKCCGTGCGGRACASPIKASNPLAVDSSTRRTLSTPRQKAGACSILKSPQICWNSCNSDDDCPGDNKCCGTDCGGRVCSSPTEEPTVFGNPFADTHIAYLKHIAGIHCSMAGGCWIRSFCQWMENAGSKPSNCV